MSFDIIPTLCPNLSETWSGTYDQTTRVLNVRGTVNIFDVDSCEDLHADPVQLVASCGRVAYFSRSSTSSNPAIRKCSSDVSAPCSSSSRMTTKLVQSVKENA